MLVGLGQMPLVGAPNGAAAAGVQPGEAEANALIQAITNLRATANQVGVELSQTAGTLAQKHQQVETLKHVLSDLRAANGLGDIPHLVPLVPKFFLPAYWDDGNLGHHGGGFFHKLKSGFSHFFQQIDKHITQPIAHPIGDALKAVDKAVIQPVAHPVADALHKLDMAVLRPVYQPIAHPIGDALHQFDKNVTMPTVKAVKKGMATLDKYVPGWSVMLNFVVPGGGLLGAAVSGATSVAGGIPIVGAVLPGMIQGALSTTGQIAQFGLKTATGQGGFWNLPVAPDSSAYKLVTTGQTLVAGVAGPLVGQVLQTGDVVLKVADQWPFTVAKETAVFLTTKGGLLQKIEATSLEAVNEVSVAMMVASAIMTGGAALAVLQSLPAALSTLGSQGLTAAGGVLSNAATAGTASVAGGALASSTSAESAVWNAAGQGIKVMQQGLQMAQQGGKFTGYDFGLLAISAAGTAMGAAAPAIAQIGTIGTVGGVAVTASDAWKGAQLALQALKQGVSLGKAADAALKVRRAADAVKRKAQIDAADLDRQTAELQAQIAALQAQAAQVRAQTIAAQQAAQRGFFTPPPASPGAQEGFLTTVARGIGVSENAVLVGGAFALLVVGALVLGEDDE